MKFLVDEVVDPTDEKFLIWLEDNCVDWGDPVYHQFIRWMNQPQTHEKIRRSDGTIR